ncbi:MAG: hypothetical protein COB30_020625 [Ectothiorhodospiraceae bacterium]|nr:hypothetical protein [Ectothiorhodospiraceae bacterium]
MLSLLIILLIAASSLHFTDLEHPSTFFSVLLPIVDVISLIFLALWLVFFFQRKGITQYTSPKSGSGSSNDSVGNGDGGGSDGT